jgi:hypothetical protein
MDDSISDPMISNRYSRWIFRALVAEIALIFFFIPAGRFQGSFFGLPFYFGGDVYKNFPILIFTWFAWRLLIPKKDIPKSLLHIPFLFCIFISTLSSLGSSDPYQSFSETLELLLYYVFYVILIDIPWRRKQILILAAFFLVGNIWMGWVTLNQYFLSGQSQGIPGLNGTFNYPNTLGLYSILGFCFFALLLVHGEQRYQKIAAWAGIFLVLMSGMASLSRASYLGLAIAILFILLRERRLLRFIPILLTVIVCIGLVTFPYVERKFTGILQELKGWDDTSRIRIWPFVLDFSVPDLSFFGHGEDPVLRDRMDSTLVATTEPFFLTHHWKPHNLIMALFLNLGLLGIPAYAWLFLAYVRQVKECMKLDQSIFYAGIIGYLVHQLFDLHHLDGNIPAALFGLFALATWMATNKTDEYNHPS